MSKVYLAVPGALDRLLGHVDEAGRISRSQAGPDQAVGYVNLETGNVYERRFGPDNKVGRVDLSSGDVYATRPGPDDYVGRVREDGRMYRHRDMAVDSYVGVADPFQSFAHSGGAMLLLVLPAIEAPTQEVPTGEG